jgi:hypothetical protein
MMSERLVCGVETLERKVAKHVRADVGSDLD